MKSRPKTLTVIALFLIAVALGLPLQIMLLYGHGPGEVLPIAAKLAPLNWAIMLMAPLVAWLVYRASPFALAAVPMLGFVVIQNNLLVSELSADYSPLAAGAASGVFLVALLPLAMKPLRDLFTHPERRWWFTPVRRRVELPVVLKIGGREHVATTFDISESGAFVQHPIEGLKPGHRVWIFLDLKRASRVACHAEVVRLSAGTPGHPSGLGIRFINLGLGARLELARFARARPAQQAAAA